MAARADKEETVEMHCEIVALRFGTQKWLHCFAAIQTFSQQTIGIDDTAKALSTATAHTIDSDRFGCTSTFLILEMPNSEIEVGIIEVGDAHNVFETETVLVGITWAIEQLRWATHCHKEELNPCDFEESVICDCAITPGKAFAMRRVHGELFDGEWILLARRELIFPEKLFAERSIERVMIPRFVVDFVDA